MILPLLEFPMAPGNNSPWDPLENPAVEVCHLRAGKGDALLIELLGEDAGNRISALKPWNSYQLLAGTRIMSIFCPWQY